LEFKIFPNDEKITIMTFFDTLISAVTNIFLGFSKTTGLSSIVLICTFFFLLLVLIFGLIILLKLKGIRKILIDVNRKMDAFSHNSRQQSSKTRRPKTIPNTGLSDQNQDRFRDNNKHVNDAQKARTTLPVNAEVNKYGTEGISDKQINKNKETTNNFNIGKIAKPLTSDPQLKSAILKLINVDNIPVSLQDIGKKLSGKYFNGNYNLILNQLKQLEKEGQIEGFLKSGKVYFVKKL